MYCMRCGRELKEEGQVFCPDCQNAMESYPIPAGTPVQIPHRPEIAPVKKKALRNKKEQKPEEQIAKLRSSNRWLGFALLITVLAFAITAFLLISTLDEPELPIGRNYSTSEQADGT